MSDWKMGQLGMNFDPAAGGVDRYFFDVLRGLGGVGMSVTAGAFGAVPEMPVHRLVSLGNATAPLPQRLRAVRKFAGELSGEARTLLAWHFALYGWAALAGFPKNAVLQTVAHFHGPWAEESAAEGQSRWVVRGKRWIERAALARARRVITLSQAFAGKARWDYRVASEKIRVVPPGVRLEQFRPQEMEGCRRVLGWPVGVPVVFCVRRLVHRMGLEELVEAWEGMSTHYSGARLILAGAGPLRGILEERVARLSDPTSVQLLGRVPEEQLPLCFAAADATMVPSRLLEGFGLVALESLACGTPVLVTPVGGLPEAVAGLDRSLILPATGIEALRAALHRVGRSVTGTRELPDRSACRTYVEGNFSPELFVRRLLAVYEEAAQPTP